MSSQTDSYTIDDFRLLTEFISEYPEVAVIPNALSEASNLLSFEGDEHARSILNKFSIFLSRAKEKYDKAITIQPNLKDPVIEQQIAELLKGRR